MQDKTGALSWRQGVMAGLPIAAGYIPIAIAFGLTANAAQVPTAVAQGMSLLVFAGASQFMAIQMIMAGAATVQIIVATFILNLRHFLMSASLAERINPDTPVRERAVIAFGITDESFAVASLRPEQLGTGFIIAVNLVAFLAWNLGTAIGLLAASGLPETIRQSLGIGLYAMFIGLLIPSGMKYRKGLVIAGLAAIINSLFLWLPFLQNLGTSWGIIIATIIAAALGTCLPSDREVTHE